MDKKESDKLEKAATKLLKKAEKEVVDKSPRKKAKLEGKYNYRRKAITNALEKEGKMRGDMTEQITLAARTGALCSLIWDELSEMDKILITESSREGDARLKINPLISTYIIVEAAHRRNLRALKMNKELENKDNPEPKEEDDALTNMLKDDD